MSLTIDVDTGGTFTDGFFTRGDEFQMVKVETTPHDLTVCFNNCIEEGARRLGFDSPAPMLEEASAIKFSTTLATNTIIQKSGPKLGIIVSSGYEENLYANGSNGAVPIEEIVPQGMVAGIRGGLEEDGLVDPDTEEVRAAVRHLLTLGARAIVICVKGAFWAPATEAKVKEIIVSDYPKHYLGAVPVFLSSDLCTRTGDHERLNATVLNAYFHRELAKYLYKAEEDLRRSHYRKPLLIVNSTGGASRVAKTTALHTYNSGPVAGFLGSNSLAGLYGLEDVVSVDMGGTSTDIGVIARGRYDYEFNPRVGDVRVNIPMIEINAIGGGGGSIARLDSSGRGVEVGPMSAGAIPGPVCYGLGGTEPTVTDADLVLGFINPDRFLGGRRSLDRDKAIEVLRERVAVPLGVSVEQSACLVKDCVDRKIAEVIEKDIHGRGYDIGDFTLFVYGGAGSCHCCGFGGSFDKLFTFPYSPVFSAFGASSLDVMHVYERILNVELGDGSGHFQLDFESMNEAITRMQEAARRDLRGEGFGGGGELLTTQLQVCYQTDPDRSLVMTSPSAFLRNNEDVESICEAFTDEFEQRFDVEPPKDGVIMATAIRLTATCELEHVELAPEELSKEDSSHARICERDVYWGREYQSTPVYDRELLARGNVVVGPAIIEQDDTTCVIPLGRKLTIDRFSSGLIERTMQ